VFTPLNSRKNKKSHYHSTGTSLAVGVSREYGRGEISGEYKLRYATQTEQNI